MSRMFDHDDVNQWDISLDEAEEFLEDVGYFPLNRSDQ